MAQLSSSSSSSKPHIVVFPFMSKGHTIPLLHLSHLLLDRGVATVTIFTTTANHPFISQSLAGAEDVSIIDLPFPPNIEGIPPGVESTDKLPSMALLPSFARGVKLMQPSFEAELEKIHSQVLCIISDGFLYWTLESASRFGIPRINFNGMSHYAGALTRDVVASGLVYSRESDDEPFAPPSFPWIQITRNDFDEPFNKRDPSGPYFDFISEMLTATENSYGVLVNTFYELEPAFADYESNNSRPRIWSVGALCLAKLHKTRSQRTGWILNWLDHKLAQENPVLYVAFGSQARISPTQLQEIALGLDEAKVNFLWVARKSDVELLGDGDAFQLKIKERGIVVTDWVDQEEILEHPIVQGFLSHCGWNSVLDGICAGVPILAWPMMADQGLNAKMVVEEMKVGLRVQTNDGRAKGFVAANGLSSRIRDLMESEKGKQLREKAKEVAQAAMKATSEGGSSWNALNSLIAELKREKEITTSKLSK